jgi:guanylate kinase
MSNKRNARGRLFVVSAPSGAGKTSLTRAAIRGLATRGRAPRFSVSYTTRTPRAGARDGVDYHFVDEAEFRRLIGSGGLLEHARVFDRFYGTGRAETERLLAAGDDMVLDIDWQGAQQVRAAADEVVSVFIMPPSLEELERRLRERALDDEATIERRLAEAEEEIAHVDEYDHVVVNDDFDRARDRLVEIFAGENPG